MLTQEYNGWTNYATWRVNLELFDGMWLPNIFEHNEVPKDLASWCREYAEEYIDETLADNRDATFLIAGWANAFIADVGWQSIADHLLNDAGWPVSDIEEA